MLLLCPPISYADNLYDYSDAPGYDNAWHTTDKWQKLGGTWDREDGSKDVDSSDDGVLWSTDGGNNWGNDDVFAGQTIKILVTMTSSGFGNHDYDQVKTWVDMNQDGYFHNIDEILIAEQFFKPDHMIIDDTKWGWWDNVTEWSSTM